MTNFASLRLSNKAQNMLSAGKIDQALSFSEQALESSPDDPRLMIQYARCLNRAGHENRSESLFLKALDKQPGNPAPCLFLGILYYDNLCFDKAIDCFGQCLHKDPENRLASRYRALTLYAYGREREAASFFLKKGPGSNPEFLSRFSMVLEPEAQKISQREFSGEAEDSSQADAEKFNFRGTGKLRRRAISTLHEEKYAESARLFRKLVEIKPSDPAAVLGLSVSLYQLCRFVEARDRIISFLDGAEEMSFPPLVSWLGRIYVRLGEFVKALRILESVPVEGPEDYNSTYFRATAQLFMGNREKAFHTYYKAFRNFYVDTREFCLDPLIKQTLQKEYGEK